MKLLLLSLLTIQPFFALCQEKHGIDFDTASDWQAIRSTASEENKLIFIDLYATWCAPCKFMDREVYPNDAVAAEYNAHFVSIRLQADSTKHDPPRTRRLRRLSDSLLRCQHVNGFPYYLFLTPDGKIVHKSIGVKSVLQFVQMGKDALDPEKRYFNKVAKWRSRRLPETEAKDLALEALHMGADSLAEAITRQHLRWLHGKAVFYPDEVEFLRNLYRFLLPGDSAFLVWMNEPTAIDSIAGKKGTAMTAVTYVIWKDAFDLPLQKAVKYREEPDWTSLAATAAKRYPRRLVDQVLLDARTSWYAIEKDDKRKFNVYIDRYRLNGIDTGGNRGVNNNMAWEIFLGSSDSVQLDIAAQWMRKLIAFQEPNDKTRLSVNENLLFANLMSTYAQILYKLGRQDQALNWQKKVIDIAKFTHYKLAIQTWTADLDKMEKGIKTWP
ncbi:MAG TPA: DUF255 domain-containing protein [Puia sp.]|nr:DUF255 domain-containing protein [Puia sp.]